MGRKKGEDWVYDTKLPIEEEALDTIGYHYIVEATGCDPEIIGVPSRIRDVLVRAAKAGDMEVKTSYFFKFTPSGVSGVVIVAESHISIHSWPECRYAALDVYVCGEASNPEASIDYILEAFGSSHAHVTEVKRGVRDEDVYTHSLLTWEEELEPETGKG